MTSAQQLYLVTIFVTSPMHALRRMFIPATSFGEAEQLTNKLEPRSSAFMVELPDPASLPILGPPRTINGVQYLIPRKGELE